MDWHSRKVLSWRVSNTLDASFCVDVLGEAIETHGTPEIFNTDQGSQFTSEDFTGVLKRHGIRISMDGKGRAMDNIMIERLWRTLKYENIYISSYESIAELLEELTLVIKDQIEFNSPAFMSRGNKILKRLNSAGK